jgi:hypothetical protein
LTADALPFVIAAVVAATTTLGWLPVCAWLTVVPAAAVLSAGVGSASLADTEAVLMIEPGEAGAVTAIVTVACAPETIVPSEHVTVLVPEHDPCEALEDCSVVPEARVSVSDTPVAGDGPASETVSV